jgi:hypothetical protein
MRKETVTVDRERGQPCNSSGELEPLVPQVLKLVFPQIEGNWYMFWAGSQWVLTSNRSEATVFPSERMARRYAAPYVAFGKVYKPEPSGAPALPASPARCRSCGCTETFACPSRCHWIERGLCSECGPGKVEIECWVVYGPTIEYPDKFVARKHLSGIPTDTVITAGSVEEIREKRSPFLVPVPRSDVDPPEIIESWM